MKNENMPYYGVDPGQWREMEHRITAGLPCELSGELYAYWAAVAPPVATGPKEVTRYLRGRDSNPAAAHYLDSLHPNGAFIQCVGARGRGRVFFSIPQGFAARYFYWGLTHRDICNN